MRRIFTRRSLTVLLIVAGGVLAVAHNRNLPVSAANVERGIAPGIAWYGVLADGLAEAERTGKPILLLSAAPQCIGVSGMW